MTKIGKGVHERKIHPIEANERILGNFEGRSVGPKEQGLCVAAEAKAELRNEKYMNKYLMEVFGKSTTFELNRLKNMRRRMDYEQLVDRKVQVLTAAAAVILAAPSIQDEEDDKQQFFSTASDDKVMENRPSQCYK